MPQDTPVDMPPDARLKNAAPSGEKPLVSIITAVFNGEKFLEQTIASVLDQTYAPVEYILIDGGSTDGTLDIIRAYEDRIACWVSEPDRGVYDAWNKGVDRANGQWLAFVGSDDILDVDAVESYMDYIQQSGTPGPEFVSSKARLVDDNLRFIRTIGQPWEWKQFLKYNNLAHVGSFHHQRLFDRFGRYDCRYQIAGDYEFLMRSGRHLKAAFMDRETVKMRSSGISNNRNALSETMHVKINAGGRNRALSYLEYCYGLLKFGLKRFVAGLVN